MSTEPARVGAPVLVVFGASGDLTARKLMPALAHLASDERLPERLHVVGVARREWTDATFAEAMRTGAAEHDAALGDAWDAFAGRMRYVRGDFRDAEVYRALAGLLDELAREHGAGERLFYLATPPQRFPDIVRGLTAAGLHRAADASPRLLVEKPYGRDLRSAAELDALIRRSFAEPRIYRIDHYLGKATVQNVLVLRFANAVFEPVWNRQYVDRIEITVAESLGVEGRGDYYDSAGVVRDILQNHLLQLLSLTAMEPPTSFASESVRDEKAKLLRAVRPLSTDSVGRVAVRGQYGPGTVDGRALPGYREEEGVPRDSTTPTYVAVRLEVDNWRWKGVPFYLRSGKRMPRKMSEIAIRFRRPPHLMFADTNVRELTRNVLVLRIQPDEGVGLSFQTNVPGLEVRLGRADLEFAYAEAFPDAEFHEAYEMLLLDCIRGDRTLFPRWDEVEASWRIVTPLLEAWDGAPAPEFPNYAAGTWGPPAADALLGPGRAWRRPSANHPSGAARS